ncbi:MAG: IS3 family transposase [Nitrospiraceae bacterium]
MGNGPPGCYATCNETTRNIFEYFEVVYNRNRRHSTIGYNSPAEIEARTAIAQPGIHETGRRSVRSHPE